MEYVLKRNSTKLINQQKSAMGIDYDCPFCRGKRKFNVNVIKGAWRCNKCGEAGYAVSLHSKLNGLSYKDALKDLGSDGYVEIKPKDMSKEPVTVSLWARDKAYNTMLQEIVLNPEHRADLLKRGLTLEQIQKNGYKSFPMSSHSLIARKCCEELKGANPRLRLPGFYDVTTNEPHMVRRRSGYLVPCRTIDGKISGFQIRHDDNSKAKYTWFTSSEKMTGGSLSGCENIHFAGDWSKIPETVYLTEGVLKADVASALSGKNFIGIAGVNNVSQLPKVLDDLKKRGVIRIAIALDMDYREKQEVAKALLHIKEIIKASGLEQVMLTWNEEYKGIDDFLLSKKN